MEDHWKYKRMREDRFSAFQWVMHYLGVSRIVYDPTWEEWDIRPNPYNPLFWVMVGVSLLLFPLFTRSAVADVIEEVRNLFAEENGRLWSLYRKDTDGVYECISRRKVLREGTPDR